MSARRARAQAVVDASPRNKGRRPTGKKTATRAATKGAGRKKKAAGRAALAGAEVGGNRLRAGYEEVKERARRRAAELSESGRDIGRLPAVVNPERKAKACGDFRYFCETYFPERFSFAWSEDHLKVLAKAQRAVLEGGLFALAMARGGGKSTIAETACMWALFYGHRLFVVLIGAEEGHALELLASMKTAMEYNDLLLEDFPEIVYPIRCLEGIPHRAKGQLYQGTRTEIGWKEKVIVLPTMPRSAASGSIVKVAGITGRIRGMKHSLVDGRITRPDLVIIDDPQTDESADSPSQCEKRTRILAGAVLRMAGPGKRISGIMPCTVIRRDDMADRILDRGQHPEWQGERMKTIYRFPSNKKLWGRYAEVLRDGYAAEKGVAPATAFYETHRTAMDKGARVAWPPLFEPGEVSALQHAMNVMILHEATFWAELQNEPIQDGGDDERLTAERVLEKFNGRRYGTVPSSCTRVTAMADVHDDVIFWAVCAWEPDTTGYVIAYGTHPDQRRAYFTTRALAKKLPKRGDKAGTIATGVEHALRMLLGHMWMRDDGVSMHADRLLVDKGYKPQSVEAAVRRIGSNIVRMSRGVGVRAKNRPYSEYTRRPGQEIGDHWLVPSLKGTQRGTLRRVDVDVNYWKSWVHARLMLDVGVKGSLTLWGPKQQAGRHRLFAEHVAKSERARVQEDKTSGRTKAEWEQVPSKPDNHWFDCLVGCAAAASMVGITDDETKRRRRMPVYRLPRRR